MMSQTILNTEGRPSKELYSDDAERLLWSEQRDREADGIRGNKKDPREAGGIRGNQERSQGIRKASSEGTMDVDYATTLSATTR